MINLRNTSYNRIEFNGLCILHHLKSQEFAGLLSIYLAESDNTHKKHRKQASL